MSGALKKRLDKIERAGSGNEEAGASDFALAYNQAYRAIAQTMDASHFFPVHTALEAFYAMPIGPSG